MSEFSRTRRLIESALKLLGVGCDSGHYDAKNFENWIIQVRAGGPFRRWHGRIISDRDQIFVDVYPQAPEDARRTLERLPSFSPSFDGFLSEIERS